MTKDEAEVVLDDDEDSPPSLLERLKRGERTLYRVPGVGHSITINETHSHVIGFTTGVLLTAIYLGGFERTGIIGTFVLVTYALVGTPFGRSLDREDPRYSSVGVQTIAYEPWHFLGVFLLGAVVVLVVSTA